MTAPVADIEKFPWLGYLLVAVAITIFALWPLASVFGALGIADHFGCAIDEGSTHACMIGGSDWGGTLGTLFVLGWFSLLTLPVGMGAGLIWVAALVVHRLSWGKRNRSVSR